MAPEMIQRRPYGCKVDIWSLGAVIIEMAEKNPPYYNLRSLKALFNTATKGAPPLKKPKKWSPEFKAFLQRCFEIDPDKRPSAAELLEVS
jgi:serine/threonine protein kinase